MGWSDYPEAGGVLAGCGPSNFSSPFGRPLAWGERDAEPGYGIKPAAWGDAMLLAMIEIGDLPRGPSDPDWDEAWRLATNLIAARISGGEAYSPSYDRW